VTLILAILVAVMIIAAQNYAFEGEKTITGYIATCKISIGEEISAENTQSITLIQGEFKELGVLSSQTEGAIALENFIPGELILESQVVSAEEYIEKREDKRYVVLKLPVDYALAWALMPGDYVQLAHFDKSQINSLKVFEDVMVYRLVRYNENDDFPSFIVLVVSEEQRDYIISNRDCGRFEVSK
jgi:Flp pilus assembly protein CpaB